MGCDKVDIGQGKNGVNELEEALLAVGPVEEPGGVEEEGEGRLALGVMLQEVLSEDLLDGVSVLSVETAIGHGAGSSSVQNATFSDYFPSLLLNKVLYLIRRKQEWTSSQRLHQRGGSQMFKANVWSLCVAFSGSYLYWSAPTDCLKRF